MDLTFSLHFLGMTFLWAKKSKKSTDFGELRRCPKTLFVSLVGCEKNSKIGQKSSEIEIFRTFQQKFLFLNKPGTAEVGSARKAQNTHDGSFVFERFLFFR